jgi:DNA primase
MKRSARKTRPIKHDRHLGDREVERLTTAAMKAIGRLADTGLPSSVAINVGGGRILHVRVSVNSQLAFKGTKTEGEED